MNTQSTRDLSGTSTHTHTQCTWVAKYWLLVVTNSVHVLPQHTVHTVLYKYWLLLVANIVQGLTLQPVLQCALLLNTVGGKWWPTVLTTVGWKFWSSANHNQCSWLAKYGKTVCSQVWLGTHHSWCTWLLKYEIQSVLETDWWMNIAVAQGWTHSWA